MSERFDSINRDDWNVILVTSQQLGIAFNINFLKRIFVFAACGVHLLLRFITEMTVRARVQDHLAFWNIRLPIAHQ
jgi:hypothetical protein